MYKVLILIMFGTSLFAQKIGESEVITFYIDSLKTQHYSFSKETFPSDERDINTFLIQNIQYLNSKNTHLQLLYYKESLGGKHYCYQQYIYGIPVYHSQIKVNILNNKKCVEAIALTFSDENIKGDYTSAEFLFPEDKQLVAANKKIENHFEILNDQNNQLLYYFDLMTYGGKSDTSAVVSIFNPDPLTTAQVTYGAPYYDNNNTSNNSIDQQMQWKKIALKIQNDTFLLENDFYKITDFDAPFTPVVSSIKDTFSFNRSQSGFEDINAFYHLNNERNHLLSLGFNNLVNHSLNIDPHAWNGAENSSFNEYSIPATLLFGEGGIDDAEDADVVVHEFAHFVSANAAPLSNIGQARKALDEGFGDYLAASYSKNISTYNWSKVFNWDGNNGSWQGRNVASTKHYPENYIGNQWKDGEIWSSALMQLNNDLGRDITDSLVLQALYAQHSNMLMPDAAYNLLDADTALFNGKNHDIIYKRMMERGFFPSNDTNKIKHNEITFVNTNAFTNSGVLNIILPYYSNGNIYVYDMSGKLINHSTYSNQINIEYFIENISAGVYIIEVTTVSDSKKTMLIRY